MKKIYTPGLLVDSILASTFCGLWIAVTSTWFNRELIGYDYLSYFFSQPFALTLLTSIAALLVPLLTFNFAKAMIKSKKDKS